MKQVLAYLDEIFGSLLSALSDPSDEVNTSFTIIVVLCVSRNQCEYNVLLESQIMLNLVAFRTSLLMFKHNRGLHVFA